MPKARAKILLQWKVNPFRYITVRMKVPKPILTIDNHSSLHEIFVDKTADFATIRSTQLGGGIENFQSSMFAKSVGK